MVSMLVVSCGEGLPPVPLDLADHNRCSEEVPYAVDASASEIQCMVESYQYVSYADEMNTCLLYTSP